MTKNQIEYNKLLEQRRTNLRNEELTASRDLEAARHNLEGEGIQRQTLGETARANRAREAETYRANLAKEALGVRQAEETERANRLREQLQSSTLAETRRSNIAKESETRRSNLATEGLRSQEIDIRSREQAETARSNLARELETARHNAAVESETTRTNKVNEAINIGRAATYAADTAARAIFYAKDHAPKVSVNTGAVGPSSSSGGGTQIDPNPGPSTGPSTPSNPRSGFGNSSRNATFGGNVNEKVTTSEKSSGYTGSSRIKIGPAEAEFQVQVGGQNRKGGFSRSR